MASSRSNTRAKPGDDPAVATDVAFALQELNACWSQAYDAMTRGELKAVAGLLTAADAYLDAAGEGLDDNPAEQALRRHAASTFGLLQHALEVGITGVRDELGRHRRGRKALRGYDRSDRETGGRVTRDA